MTTEIELNKVAIEDVMESILKAFESQEFFCEKEKEKEKEAQEAETEKVKEKEEEQLGDISGNNEVESVYESCPTRKWIKLVSLDKTIHMQDYNRKEHFIKVADVVLDDEIMMSGKKEGKKKRNTLIQFLPAIPLDEFNKKTEWLYLMLINDRIVKIGGTRVGLARANQIVNGETLSEDTILRMYSFFSRHEVDKKAEGFNSGEDGFPSPGRVAWDLWGGDAGFRWSTSKRDQMQGDEGKSLDCCTPGVVYKSHPFYGYELESSSNG